MPIVAFDISLPVAGYPKSVAIGIFDPLSQSETFTTVPAAWDGSDIATPIVKAAIDMASRIDDDLLVCLSMNNVPFRNCIALLKIPLTALKHLDPCQSDPQNGRSG